MCNCQSNSFGCANTNCSCPPSYSITPATLTCQGTPCEQTLPTSCIFSTSYLNCTKLNIGTDLQTVLNAMDAKICACGSCSGITDIPLFWVNSHNTVNGTGSVTNPFKTLDLAYTACIGAGSVNTPDNPGVTFMVAQGSYTTNQNIYIPGTSWYFFPNALVQFTGSGTYFIDSSVAATGADDFSVLGFIQFKTSTGAFVRNSGVQSSSAKNKHIYIECYTVESTTSAGTLPVITIDPGAVPASSNTPVELDIRLQGQHSHITSLYQQVITQFGGHLYIDLQEGYIGTLGGANVGLMSYNVTDTQSGGRVRFRIANGYMLNLTAAGTVESMITMTGYFNYFVIDNIRSINANNNNAKRFLQLIAPLTLVSISSTHVFLFLLKDVYLTPNCFVTGSGGYTIDYTGTSNTFNQLQMQNCNLYASCTVNPAQLLPYLGLDATPSANPVVCTNIINGDLHMTNLPTVTTGLPLGSIWRNSGVLTIV